MCASAFAWGTQPNSEQLWSLLPESERNLGFWAQCVLRQLSDSVGAFDVINPFGSFDLRRLGPAVGRGGSLSELYISAKRILLRARDGIERLERFESAALMDSSDLTSSVKRDITEVQSLCASMDGYGAQSPLNLSAISWEGDQSVISKFVYLQEMNLLNYRRILYRGLCIYELDIGNLRWLDHSN